MRELTNEEKQELQEHCKWLMNDGGKRLNWLKKDLSFANLSDANLSFANLIGVNLSFANLSGADLYGANLTDAILSRANLFDANLSGVTLSDANLTFANLSGANLSFANLSLANLSDAKGLIKSIGVEVGNYYWKRIDKTFSSNGYYFTVGLNKLRDGEEFAADERVLCSYPGFYFASRSWCQREYGERLYEVKIQISKGAKINEPWATDGKASASMIKIVQVIDSETGKDVTNKFKKFADGKGNKL